MADLSKHINNSIKWKWFKYTNNNRDWYSLLKTWSIFLNEDFDEGILVFKRLLTEVQIHQPSIWGHLWYGSIYLSSLILNHSPTYTLHVQANQMTGHFSSILCFLPVHTFPSTWNTSPHPTPPAIMFPALLEPSSRALWRLRARCNLLLAPNILDLQC